MDRGLPFAEEETTQARTLLLVLLGEESDDTGEPHLDWALSLTRDIYVRQL